MPSWLPHPRQPRKSNHLQQSPCHQLGGKRRPEEQDHQEEEEDRASLTPFTTLLGPLEEGIRVAEGGILEVAEGEGAIRVTPETQALEETHRAMTNYRANSRLSLKETDENPKVSCKNGTYITASIDTPLK